ncbi:MAG: hypothetical protein ABSC56_05300 [Solirubrobacteraceae bacterium]|jgi:hypothetical protein
MGRRGRQRGGDQALAAADASYTDAEGNTLVLRGALSPRTRAAYARIASGKALPRGATREDAWHRSVEFLFEHLATSWTIAGTSPLVRPNELLGRLRLASSAERTWVRECLREHCAERFPDLAAP